VTNKPRLVLASLSLLLTSSLSTSYAQTDAGRTRTVGLDAGTAIQTPTRTEGPSIQFQGSQTVSTQNVGGTGSVNTRGDETANVVIRGDNGPAPDQLSGPLGPADAVRLVQAQMPRFRPCYDTARTTRPRLAGSVEVRFTISNEGRVTEATATGLPDAPTVATCVADQVRQLTFPRPQARLQVAHTLHFVPPPPPPRRPTRPLRPSAQH